MVILNRFTFMKDSKGERKQFTKFTQSNLPWTHPVVTKLLYIAFQAAHKTTQIQKLIDLE